MNTNEHDPNTLSAIEHWVCPRKIVYWCDDACRIDFTRLEIVCVFGTWMTEDDMSLWCLVRVKQSAEPAVCLRIGYRGRIDAYNCWLRCVHQRCWRFSNQKPTSPRFPEPGRASMLSCSSSSELRLQYSDFSDSNSIKLDRKSFERSGFYSDFHTAQIARSNEISLSRSNTICVHFFLPSHTKSNLALRISKSWFTWYWLLIRCVNVLLNFCFTFGFYLLTTWPHWRAIKSQRYHFIWFFLLPAPDSIGISLW